MNPKHALASLALMSFSSPASVSAAELTALWQFEETSGLTAIDSVASLPGELGGGATLDVAGKFGSGIDFSADDIDAANVTTTTPEGHAATQPTGDFSVLVWIRPTADDLTNNFNRFIDTSSNTGAITTGYRLMSQSGATVDQFRFLGDSGASNTSILHSRKLVADTWTLLAVRYDTDGLAALNVLMDGDTVDSTFVNTNIQSGAANGPIVYAADEDTVFGAQDTPLIDNNDYEGLMDDAAFFSGLLTDAEIATVFNSGVNPPVDVPLTITQVDHDGDLNTMTLTWDSVANHLYDGEFSTDMTEWFRLNQETTATSDETTKTFDIPPNQKKFYLRIIDLGLD